MLPRKYVTLREAFERFEKGTLCAPYGNIYATVVDWSAPKKSKGTDLFVNLWLCDESTEGWEGKEKIDLMVFGSSAWELPTTRKVGDIIRLHDVKVQAFGEKPQLYGKVHKGKGARFQYSQFPHQEGENADVPYHYFNLGASVEVTDTGKQRLAQLRECGLRLINAIPRPALAPIIYEAGGVSYLRRVTDLLSSIMKQPPEIVDLICKVLAIDSRDQDFVVLHVWDGSDLPPTSSSMDRESDMATRLLGQSILSRRHRALPLCATTKASTLVGMCAGSVEACSRDEMPRLGSSVPLLVPRALLQLAAQDGVKSLAVGLWVKLKMLVPALVRGQVQLLFSSSSKVTPRSCEEGLGGILAAYNARLQSGAVCSYAPVDLGFFRSRSICPADLSAISIRDLLYRVQEGACGVCRLNALVSRIEPGRAEEALLRLGSNEGELNLPDEEVSPEAALCGHTYGIKMLLTDATGEMEVVLLGSDAELFFTDLPPFDPACNSALVRSLQEWLSWLVEVPSPLPIAPDQGRGTAHRWLDCCIKVASLEPVDLQGSVAWTMPCLRMVQTVGRKINRQL